MSRGPRASWAAWTGFVLALALTAADIIANLQNSFAAHHHLSMSDWIWPFIQSLSPLTFAAVGGLIVIARPVHRIGWIMIGIGLINALSTLASDYPGYSSTMHRFTRPHGFFVAWLSTWDWPYYLLGLMLLLLLFPTGEVLNRRWRSVMWIGATAYVVVSLLEAVHRAPVQEGYPRMNPFGLIQLPDAVFVAVLGIGLLATAAAAVSLVLRFRAARGDERLQLKWFTYGTTIALTSLILAFATLWTNGLLAVAALLSFAAVPICIGFAILRYRLYDIDVIINRTLVYGALSVCLAAVYIGTVILLQSLLRLLAGQSNGESPLVIALSTFAVAALFGPLRVRVQAGIDQRFYRRKYDATRTLAGLNRRLRDETDLGTITSIVQTVLSETMQPVSVSVSLIERRNAGSRRP